MNIENVHFRHGDLVEVLPFADIRATLDAQGRDEGLPFMPEMIPYCGHRFQVYRRADKTFLDRHNTAVRLKNMVFLKDVRCDGQAHGGCQMGCLMFWHEAWLRPANDERAIADAVFLSHGPNVNLPTMIGSQYCCQATELKNCGPTLPWWELLEGEAWQ